MILCCWQCLHCSMRHHSMRPPLLGKRWPDWAALKFGRISYQYYFSFCKVQPGSQTSFPVQAATCWHSSKNLGLLLLGNGNFGPLAVAKLSRISLPTAANCWQHVATLWIGHMLWDNYLGMPNGSSMQQRSQWKQSEVSTVWGEVRCQGINRRVQGVVALPCSRAPKKNKLMLFLPQCLPKWGNGWEGIQWKLELHKN